MTRHEEIFAALGAVKGMRLRETSNKLLATAWKVDGVGRGAFFGAPRCMCFSANTVTKNAPRGHPPMAACEANSFTDLFSDRH